MEKQTVFIIEDETILRELLSTILHDKPNLDLIGTDSDGKDGLQQCLELKPDMVILDSGLPSMSGIEVAKHLKIKRPETKIFLYSGHFSSEDLVNVHTFHIDGIARKPIGFKELSNAITTVAAGNTYQSECLNLCTT